MFGGMFYDGEDAHSHVQTFYNDTWLFSMTERRWSQLRPTPGDARDGLPSARALHRLATFTPPNYTHPLVLMFGGRLAAGAKDTHETWVLEILNNTGHLTTDRLDAKWYLVPRTDIQPSPRTGHAMSNLGRDSVVLFGGYDSDEKAVLGDTWVFVGDKPTTAHWHHIAYGAATSKASDIISDVYVPPSRRFASFASFDAETALLYGGTSETEWETNEYSPFSDASTWHLSRNTADSSVPPEKRYTWRRIVPFQVRSASVVFCKTAQRLCSS